MSANHEHHVHADDTSADGTAFDQQYWEHRYGTGHSASESNANPYVAEQAAALTQGTALDAGCGEGATAIWLAEHGWQVTAVDIAAAAVDRGRATAQQAGTDTADRIDWVTADLTQWDAGTERFDLVCACYVHPAESNDALVERLAAAVAPGGSLLIVGHAPGDEQSGAHAESVHTQVTADQIAAGLDPAHWEIRRAERRTRTATRSDGFSTTMQDSVLHARKAPSGS